MRHVIVTLIVLLIAAILWFALGGRAWLKRQPWGWSQRFFAWIEPLEIRLYRKSEQLLVSRAMIVGGLLITGYDGIAWFAGQADLTPITTYILKSLVWIPEELRPMFWTGVTTAFGYMMQKLRNKITKPIEVVALPDAKPPEVAAAVERVEHANAVAGAAVAQAKAEGKM